MPISDVELRYKNACKAAWMASLIVSKSMLCRIDAKACSLEFSGGRKIPNQRCDSGCLQLGGFLHVFASLFGFNLFSR